MIIEGNTFSLSIMKQCRDCHKHLTLLNFSSFLRKAGTESEYRYFRPECESCRSATNQRRKIEKLLDKYPHRYHECDECDHIWNNYHGDTCKKCGTRKLRNYEKRAI